LQAEVVDAAAAPRRRLPVALGVALDDEDVQLGVRADADDGHRLVTVLPVVAGWSDLGVEDLGIKPAQPGGVLGRQAMWLTPSSNTVLSEALLH
jgi:hypothetical protein